MKRVIIILLSLAHSLACLGKQDVETVYFLIPPAPVNHLNAGTVLGIAHDGDGSIVFAGVGEDKLPEGIHLGDDGTLVVTRPELLTPGTYQFTVTTVDDKNNISANKVSFTLLEPGPPNRSSVGRVYPKKPLEAYQKGDLLAEILDRDGQIREVKLVKGSIPEGTALSPNGKLKVSNPALLMPGTYDFLFLAVDNKYQGCFLSLTVSVPFSENSLMLGLDSAGLKDTKR